MHGTRRIAIGIGLSLVLATAATAQRPMQGGDGAGGLARMVSTPAGINSIMVLLTPAVQEELKMEEGQKTKVFELSREAQQKGRERLQALMRSGGNGQALMATGAQMRQENEKAAAAILKPEQKERVDQIMLQIEGPLAVIRPEMAKKLDLNAKQNQAIQYTTMQMAQAVREVWMMQMQNNNGGFNPLQGIAGLPREPLNLIRRDAVKQLGKILDAKQKANFNKMLGEPFDLAKIDPDLARPAATTADASTKTERAKAKRKGSAKAKTASEEETPKP